MYLFRVSTKSTDPWGTNTPKPIYVVAADKEKAKTFAEKHLRSGLAVRKVSQLARQMGMRMFSGA